MHIQQIQHEIKTHHISWDEVERRLRHDEIGKRDIETSHISMAEDGSLTLDGQPGYRLTETSESSVFSRFVPGGVEYVKRCPPYLKALNLNHWISQKSGKTYFVRTRETESGHLIRAILTERYAQYDNLALFEQIAEHFRDFIPVHLALSDTSFHLRLVQPTGVDVSVREVEDIVHGGVLLCNSETGQGSLRLAVISYRLKCKNGLVSPENTALHVKVHLGSHGDIAAFFTQAITEAREQADVLIHALKDAHHEVFDRQHGKHLVAYIGKRFKWPKAFVEAVENNIYAEDATKFGMIQAITGAARELAPEERLRYERQAGSLLLLSIPRMAELAVAEVHLAAQNANPPLLALAQTF